ncbi:hypothetical protein CL656_07090 [bacterium]|nr:hypothetical protein [bacterium]|tara:strand:+ start:672 stop:1238 length:567 start_codon:yes stop_codon:yes gene_type:complete
MQNNNDFTSIDDLPVNPQKSGEQPPMMDPINRVNQSNAIQDSLDFPEDFKTDLNNIVIDEKAMPTYSNEKENINNEKRVRFQIPDKINSYDEDSHLNNLYVNDINNTYNKLTPLMQLVLLSSILFFIILNPLVKENLIKIVNNINIVKITEDDGNLNIFGKLLFSIVFGFSLFSLIQLIHSSSLQIVF